MNAHIYNIQMHVKFKASQCGYKSLTCGDDSEGQVGRWYLFTLRQAPGPDILTLTLHPTPLP